MTALQEIKSLSIPEKFRLLRISGMILKKAMLTYLFQSGKRSNLKDEKQNSSKIRNPQSHGPRLKNPF